MFTSGPNAFENKHQDKPANVTVKPSSGNKMLGKIPYLFQVPTIVLFIGCFYPVYKHITTMEKTIQEIQAKQEKTEMKLNKTVERLNEVNIFVEEFNNAFSNGNALSDKHSSTIQLLRTSIDIINGKLVEIKDELKERTTSINKRLETAEGCQSGTEVGEHTYPAQAFPLERTVTFNPPFKKVPAFSYGTTLLDSTSHLSVHLQLLSLTTESFKIKFHTWGKRYALYGARVSWMACPK